MRHLSIQTTTDKAFAIALALKGIDALGEVAGGLWLLLIDPRWLQGRVAALVAPELREDPHDFIAVHILHWAIHLRQHAVLFASVYLLSHGLTKLVVLVEIVRGRLWAYPGLIVLTALFAVYQLYHMAVTGLSPGYLALTLFDLLIIALTAVEYTKLRSHRRRGHCT
ncbi:DUF2127 domain-containing protein [Dyella sp. A6]|uniref:DUF2127 domain-containing protein n=1 Tax=Dyella aluminiiresistens TaxID=3069105 RepID=UPI002E78EAC6|nr:DUF2127 domain-containing protein [Dyella sp. A6]